MLTANGVPTTVVFGKGAQVAAPARRPVKGAARAAAGRKARPSGSAGGPRKQMRRKKDGSYEFYEDVGVIRDMATIRDIDFDIDNLDGYEEEMNDEEGELPLGVADASLMDAAQAAGVR